MMRTALTELRWLILVAISATAAAQIQPVDDAPVSAPVPYASISQLNTLLTQLEDASKSTQGDLSKLRIEKWKTDGGNKRLSQSNVDSIQRNLQNALPTILTELRNTPESLSATFKLCRNLDALYDVFSTVVESAGAFGSKDEFQSLDNDLNAISKSRRSIADRMESLSGAKDAELTRLRASLKTAQAAAPAAQPKKIVVDDNEPPKKPVKKKAAPKPAATPASTPAKTQ